MAFYSAVHAVSAYFWERYNKKHSGHVGRRADMVKESDLDPIMDAYDELYQWSRDARYAARPKITSRDAADALDDAAIILRHVRGLLGV